MIKKNDKKIFIKNINSQGCKYLLRKKSETYKVSAKIGRNLIEKQTKKSEFRLNLKNLQA